MTILDKMRDVSKWRQLTLAEAAKVIDLLEAAGKAAEYTVDDDHDADFVEAFERLRATYREVGEKEA